MDGRTDGQTDRQRDRQTDRQATYKDLGVSMATGVNWCEGMHGGESTGWMGWTDDG